MSTYDSRLEEDFFKINGGPVNKSKTKQLYSFPKAERFRHKDLSNCSKSFYDPKIEQNTKGTSLGYGEKTNFTKLFTITPAPGTYNSKSSFIKNDFSKSTQNFGPSRVSHKFDQAPGPNSYHLGSTLSQVGYSMRLKNEPKSGTQVPGPGTYNQVDTLGPQRLKISQFINAPMVMLDTRDDRQQNYNDKVPGPQHYMPQNSFSSNGRYTQSNYISQPQGAFGKNEPRLPTAKTLAPGPCTYRIPGEFGFY